MSPRMLQGESARKSPPEQIGKEAGQLSARGTGAEPLPRAGLTAGLPLPRA